MSHYIVILVFVGLVQALSAIIAQSSMTGTAQLSGAVIGDEGTVQTGSKTSLPLSSFSLLNQNHIAGEISDIPTDIKGVFQGSEIGGAGTVQTETKKGLPLASTSLLDQNPASGKIGDTPTGSSVVNQGSVIGGAGTVQTGAKKIAPLASTSILDQNAAAGKINDNPTGISGVNQGSVIKGTATTQTQSEIVPLINPSSVNLNVATGILDIPDRTGTVQAKTVSGVLNTNKIIPNRRPSSTVVGSGGSLAGVVTSNILDGSKKQFSTGGGFDRGTVIYDINNQGLCREVTRNADDNCLWMAGMDTTVDRKIVKGTIIAYQNMLPSGKYSKWYVPGINDLDLFSNFKFKKCNIRARGVSRPNPPRRMWSKFSENKHKFILCTIPKM